MRNKLKITQTHENLKVIGEDKLTEEPNYFYVIVGSGQYTGGDLALCPDTAGIKCKGSLYFSLLLTLLLEIQNHSDTQWHSSSLAVKF